MSVLRNPYVITKFLVLLIVSPFLSPRYVPLSSGI